MFRKGILDKCYPFIVRIILRKKKKDKNEWGGGRKKIRKIKVIDIRMEECSRIEWKID